MAGGSPILRLGLWAAAWVLASGQRECTAQLPPRTEWYSMHERRGVADRCTPELKDSHVLQVIRPLCVHQGRLFTACPTVNQGINRILEWYGINRLDINPPSAFESSLRSGQVEWINGTSFGSYLGQFPHSVQGIMPLLNLPMLHHAVCRFVQLPASDNFPQGHGLEHTYTMALLEAVGRCLGLEKEDIVGQRAWWHERWTKTTCFETMVVPLIRYNPCGHVFVESEWATTLMSNLRTSLYRALALAANASEVPRTITLLHRHSNRYIINRQDVLLMLNDFGWDVKLVETELGRPFEKQVEDMANTGILVTTHGANMVNAMFLPKGAVVIEVHLHPFWIPCYWGQFLAKVGVNHLKWCYPMGHCQFAKDWPTAYPRDNAVVKVDTLRPIVARAVRLVKDKLTCFYSSSQFDCVPRKQGRFSKRGVVPGNASTALAI